MKRIVLTIGLLFSLWLVSAQAPAKYWVQFKDKAHSTYSVDRPSEFLSDRAIQKRQKFNISITEQDLPVSQHYIKELLSIDSTMVLFTQSKWLNGVTVYCVTENIAEKISSLPFVVACERTISMKKVENFDYPYYEYKQGKLASEPIIKGHNFDYGYSEFQMAVNNAQWLHRIGACGEGMLMVVMDAGFCNVPKIGHFDALRQEGRLLGVRNFVQPGRTVFGSESHGTNVLSCIASYKPGELIGTAPKASFFLAQTEDSRTENLVEEDNWVAGVEWADSLGCDVLNSSLGYTKFDDTLVKRSFEDLNGKVSRASQAATIAVSKGMIICNSAGNEGNGDWHYIGSPADAQDIITVGAVDYKRQPASFSSFGPTADGRVKPDAAAVGQNTFVCNINGYTDNASGTSFSSPLLSGMVTCLWQLFPDKSNYEIMEAVRLSGANYLHPTAELGYGITNFLVAHNYLAQSASKEDLVFLFVNSVTRKSSVGVYLKSNNTTDFTVDLSLLGSDKIIHKEYTIKRGQEKSLKLKVPKLPKGENNALVIVKVNDLTCQTSYVMYLGLVK